MNILGISAFYHDSAACLVQDGTIVAAAQEERFTRRKHDAAFPERAIASCLAAGGVRGANLDAVAFYDKPWLKFERLLRTYLAFAPRGRASFCKAMPLWLRTKLWIKEYIADALRYDGPIIFPQHHESHAASAFFPSPFADAAWITFDGVGEWSTTSYGVGHGNRVTMLADIQFPHSLGMLYSAFTSYTGFKVNSGEYKVMGLAPYGAPVYVDQILTHLIDLKHDGSFWMDQSYFNYCAGRTMTSEKFHALFGGPPRDPESPLEQRHMDLARSIQVVTEEAMMRIARHVHAQTGQRNLCLAGGVALNCVGNGRILREGPFDALWIQPAAGDAGGALGAALLAWYEYFGNARTVDGTTDAQRGSFLGPAYDGDAIRQFLDRESIPYTTLADDALPAHVAALIADGNVIGWFQGRMEFGPRALGNRSILGDARSPTMQETMNLKIKFRESFRPFAPAVIAEDVAEHFAFDGASPYMLLIAPVRRDGGAEDDVAFHAATGIEKLKRVRSAIPAVTHVDYSARLQTVHRATNPRFHALLEAFRARTDCSVMINTSFNVRGEPIVCTPEDAFRCFMRTNIDYLVLGNILLDKRAQQPMEEMENWRETFPLD